MRRSPRLLLTPLYSCLLLAISSSAFTVVQAFVSAQAQQAGAPDPAAAAAVQADLEARIRILERRLAEMEGKTRSGRAAPQRSTTERTTAERAQRPVQPQPRPAADPPRVDAAANEQPRRAQGASDVPAPLPVDPASGRPEATATGSDQAKALQASFIFRDTAPTLQSNRWEVSAEGNYIRNTGILQSDRGYQGSVSMRYGLEQGLEIAAIIPYYGSSRTLQTFANPVETSTESWGDIAVQLSKQLWAPSDRYPGASLMIGGTAPTGRDPYDRTSLANYVERSDPTDGLRSTQSRGHWGAVSNLQFYKTFDPIILFFGGGIDYTFAKDVLGHTLEPGIRYNFNGGFSFALSEYTTMGFQVLGSYQTGLRVDGTEVRSGAQEQWRGRFVLIERLSRDVYVEPSATFGLTQESPSLQVGVAVRYRN